MYIEVLPTWTHVTLLRNKPYPVHKLGDRMTGRVVLHPGGGSPDTFTKVTITHTVTSADGTLKQMAASHCLLAKGEFGDHKLPERREFPYSIPTSSEDILPSYFGGRPCVNMRDAKKNTSYGLVHQLEVIATRANVPKPTKHAVTFIARRVHPVESEGRVQLVTPASLEVKVQSIGGAGPQVCKCELPEGHVQALGGELEAILTLPPETKKATLELVVEEGDYDPRVLRKVCAWEKLSKEVRAARKRDAARAAAAEAAEVAKQAAKEAEAAKEAAAAAAAAGAAGGGAAKAADIDEDAPALEDVTDEVAAKAAAEEEVAAKAAKAEEAAKAAEAAAKPAPSEKEEEEEEESVPTKPITVRMLLDDGDIPLKEPHVPLPGPTIPRTARGGGHLEARYASRSRFTYDLGEADLRRRALHRIGTSCSSPWRRPTAARAPPVAR